MFLVKTSLGFYTVMQANFRIPLTICSEVLKICNEELAGDIHAQVKYIALHTSMNCLGVSFR